MTAFKKQDLRRDSAMGDDSSSLRPSLWQILLSAVLIIAFALTLSENPNPLFIYLLPYAVFVLFLLHATLQARELARNSPERVPLMFALVSAPFLCVSLSAVLVAIPLERLEVTKYALLGFIVSMLSRKESGPMRVFFTAVLCLLVAVGEAMLRWLLLSGAFRARDLSLPFVSVALGLYYCFLLMMLRDERSVKPAGMPRSKDLSK